MTKNCAELFDWQIILLLIPPKKNGGLEEGKETIGPCLIMINQLNLLGWRDYLKKKNLEGDSSFFLESVYLEVNST